MSNINVETKIPSDTGFRESLLPAAVAGYTRGLAVVYGSDAYHAQLVSAAGVTIVGVIGEDAVSTQNPIPVVEDGACVVQIGAAVTAGALLAVNASGQFVPAATGNYIVAKALEANPNAGDYVAALLTGGTAKD